MVKSQMATAVTLYGAPFGVEPVSVEDLAPSLQRQVYITKHEWIALTWEMYLYKPKGTWVPEQLQFVDQFQYIGRKK